MCKELISHRVQKLKSVPKVILPLTERYIKIVPATLYRQKWQRRNIYEKRKGNRKESQYMHHTMFNTAQLYQSKSAV